MESHLSKQCCQRSHDVVLHHVLTHLLTSTCTQIPVKGRHTQTHSHQLLRGDSRSEMLFVIVCVCVGEESRGVGGSREIHCEQWFCFDFEETKCYLGFTERPQIRLEVNINMTHSTVLIMHSMVLRTMYNTVQKSFLFLPISALSDGVAKGYNTFLHL